MISRPPSDLSAHYLSPSGEREKVCPYAVETRMKPRHRGHTVCQKPGIKASPTQTIFSFFCPQETSEKLQKP